MCYKTESSTVEELLKGTLFCLCSLDFKGIDVISDSLKHLLLVLTYHLLFCKGRLASINVHTPFRISYVIMPEHIP